MSMYMLTQVYFRCMPPYIQVTWPRVLGAMVILSKGTFLDYIMHFDSKVIVKAMNIRSFYSICLYYTSLPLHDGIILSLLWHVTTYKGTLEIGMHMAFTK